MEFSSGNEVEVIEGSGPVALNILRTGDIAAAESVRVSAVTLQDFAATTGSSSSGCQATLADLGISEISAVNQANGIPSPSE